MKTTDFINESFVEDAAAAHQDHEVQMARGDCYNAAKYAIELHKLLKNISEQQGLDGWVSEKITLANDYLRTVTEYLRYEQQSDSSGMDEFNPVSATQTLDAALGESAPKHKPAVVKTNKPIGSRVADIGPGGKEYNVKTDAEWDKQNKQKDVKEGMRGTVSFPDDEGTHTGNNPPVSLGGTFDKRPEVKAGKLVKASGLSGVWRVNDIRGDSANITQEIPNTSKSYSSIPVSDLRVWTNKPVKEQGVEEGKADPTGSWVVYDGSKVKRFKSRTNAKAYAAKTGGKVASSEFYADNVQKQGVAKGALNEFAPGDGDSGRWYSDDDLADIVGEDWYEFDVSHEMGNIGTQGERARIFLAREAESYLQDRGYNVNVLDVRDQGDNLSWYISGSLMNEQGVAEGEPDYSVPGNWSAHSNFPPTKVLGSVYNTKGVYLGKWDGKRLIPDPNRDSVWHKWRDEQGDDWARNTIATAPQMIQQGRWTVKQDKQGVDEDMSRAAKGNEKYGKAGMQALAKAGREGASEKELDTIRDKHDKYKNVSETTSSGGVATSMGGGNGFANGGPGTIARPKMKKKNNGL